MLIVNSINFGYSIRHVTEVVELSDWILDVHWLRNSDQSVGVSSTRVCLIASHTLARYHMI